MGKRWAVLAVIVMFGGAFSVAQQLDRFIFLQNTEIGSLSPARDFSVSGLGVHAHLFDPLVDFEGPALTLTPKLAESWVALDDTSWLFTLRSGIQFHDGSTLTADDVKFSLELYGEDGSVRKGYVSSIDSVEVQDSLTVRIITKQPDAALLSRLAYLYILPKAYFERVGEAGFATAPVGTGAYRFVSWERDVELVLAANDGYWGVPATVRQLIIKPVIEASARLAELQTGRADVISGVPVEMAEQLLSDPSVRLVRAPGVRQVYYPLNTLTPPLDDVRVRRAINYAIDRDAIVEYILGGYGETRGGPFAERQWGAGTDTERYSFNPELARELLREAGYEDGLTVTWDMTPGAIVMGVDIAEAVANMLGQVGITVTLDMMENSRRLELYYAGDFDITMTTWSLQSDPDAILSGLRVESTVGAFLKNEEVDRLLTLGRTTLDPVERESVYGELEQLLIDVAPWMLIHAQDELYGVRADVDWEPYPFGGNAGMTYRSPVSAE